MFVFVCVLVVVFTLAFCLRFYVMDARVGTVCLCLFFLRFCTVVVCSIVVFCSTIVFALCCCWCSCLFGRCFACVVVGGGAMHD